MIVIEGGLYFYNNLPVANETTANLANVGEHVSFNANVIFINGGLL